MALWRRIKQFPANSVILKGIEGLYGNFFPIQVREHMAEFIEEKFWISDIDPTYNDSPYDNFELFNDLIDEIEKTSEEFLSSRKNIKIGSILANAAVSFRHYSEDPTAVVHFIRQSLEAERNFLEKAGVNFGEVRHLVPATDNAGIFQLKLNDVNDLCELTNEGLEPFKQDCKTYMSQRKEFRKHDENLGTFKEGTEEQQVPDIFIKEYINEKEILTDLKQWIAAFKRKGKTLIRYYYRIFHILHFLKYHVMDKEIERWKRAQQLQQNGGSNASNSSLDDFQGWCENLLDFIWTIRRQLKSTLKLTEKIAVINCHNGFLIHFNNYTVLLRSIMNSSFILESQSDQVIKPNIKFECILRLLIGNRFGVHLDPPTVRAIIVSEALWQSHIANCISFDRNTIDRSVGELHNNSAPMMYNRSRQRLNVFFSELGVIRYQKTRQRVDDIAEQKYILMFFSKFTIGDIGRNGKLEPELLIKVHQKSLPVVIAMAPEHVAQATATVVWDNAFGVEPRIPLYVPNQESWGKVAEMLSNLAKKKTGRSLTEEDVRYLAMKVSRGRCSGCPECGLSWRMFCKEPLDYGATFFQWFYAVLVLIEEHLLGPWLDGGISTGFIRRQDAEEMLSPCRVGTFLLRFSDSEVGGITVAWVAERMEVRHLQPFKAKDLRARSLADRLSDLKFLKFLFPDIPKEDIFQKHSTAPEERQTTNGYYKIVMKTNVLGMPEANDDLPAYSYTGPRIPRDNPFF